MTVYWPHQTRFVCLIVVLFIWIGCVCFFFVRSFVSSFFTVSFLFFVLRDQDLFCIFLSFSVLDRSLMPSSRAHAHTYTVFHPFVAVFYGLFDSFVRFSFQFLSLLCYIYFFFALFIQRAYLYSFNFDWNWMIWMWMCCFFFLFVLFFRHINMLNMYSVPKLKRFPFAKCCECACARTHSFSYLICEMINHSTKPVHSTLLK